MKTAEQIQQELSEPFPVSVVSWRPGVVRGEDTERPTCLAFGYVQVGAVMDRLDEVVGIANWEDIYETAPNQERQKPDAPNAEPAVMCTLKLRIDGEWVAKADVAENTDVEGVKGGFSDSLKRAAVKWGVGRYLKRLPPQWAPCIKRGKSWVIAPEWEPKLPRWAIPDGGPMREPQPRSDPPANLDKATAELQGDEPYPPPPNDGPMTERQPTPISKPAPAGDLQSEWNRLCQLMQSVKPALPSAMVGQSMGGKFDRNTFARWLENGTTRSAASLIDDAIRDRDRASAPAN